MAVNSIFHTNNKNSILTERNLYKDLIKEAIQIYGHDVYYVDRTLVARDNVLGEDALSKFPKARSEETFGLVFSTRELEGIFSKPSEALANADLTGVLEP